MKKIIVTLICFAMLSCASTVFALNVTTVNDGAELVDNILGSGISVSDVQYNGADGASGIFTGGQASGLGMESGILLTSGQATDAVGPNTSDGTGSDNGTAGDSDLDALIPGYTTLDATVLEFDFTTTSGDLYFNFVFASEEYNEWVGSSFNDVFGFFLDGENIALLPDQTTPVSINNVNNSVNSEYYNDNDPGYSSFDVEYDGFTTVLTAKALNIGEGTHHIKLAIADAGDSILDSGVFIEAGTFSPYNPIPEPSTLLLLGMGLLGLIHLKRKHASK
jgi:hypothetical protein